MEGIKKSERNNKEEWEDKIQDLIKAARLPEKIVDGWDEKFHAKPLEDQYKALVSIVERRHSALNTNRSISPSHVDVVGESPLAVQKMIERLAEGGHEEIGKGKSGRVIASLRNPDICYKVFFPPEHQPRGTNDIAIEADLQREVANLGEIVGVRTPVVKYFIQNQTVRAIAMERLHAVSVEDVLEGRAALPAAFDIKRFFPALHTYMEALHEKGFYHRDLHGGNVLIDTETGMPYVIDFGHATHTISDEGVYKPEIIVSGRLEPLVLLSDKEAPKRLEQRLSMFISQQESSWQQ